MWTEIPKHPNYFISKLGLVKSPTGKILKPKGNNQINIVDKKGARTTKSINKLLKEVYTDVHLHPNKWRCYYCKDYFTGTKMKDVALTVMHGTCYECHADNNRNRRNEIKRNK